MRGPLPDLQGLILTHHHNNVHAATTWGNTVYKVQKEFIAWHIEAFRNELRCPTYGGFISIGGVLLGASSCLWEVEGLRGKERCIAALGLVKQSNAGLRAGFKRDPTQKKIKGY
jgi:hypothetical protein